MILIGNLKKHYHYTSEKSHENEYLSQVFQQAKSTYSPLGKTFENQTKTIKDIGDKKIEVAEKQKQLIPNNESAEYLKKSLIKGIQE